MTLTDSKFTQILFSKFKCRIILATLNVNNFFYNMLSMFEIIIIKNYIIIIITKSGESGFRSRCLVVANDALYRLS